MRVSRRSLVQLLVIITLSLTLFWALFPVIKQATSSGESQINLSGVARYTHLQFPRGTQLAGGILQSGGRDGKVFAKVTMNKSALVEFKSRGFAAINQQPPVFSDPAMVFKQDSLIYRLKPRQVPDWWAPESVINGEATEINFPLQGDPKQASDDWLAILIDSGPEEAEVYLLAAFW